MIRIFAGCAPNHEDAESQAVLEWSIAKHASEPFEITWLKLSRGGPLSGWNTINWPTPFSGFRWAVPELAGFEGRAIYTDSDVIFMDDIAGLWHQPIPEVVVARNASRLCVSLWDCNKAKSYMVPIDSLKQSIGNHAYMRFVFAHHNHIVTRFSGNWNCLDGENYASLDDIEIKAIHYTSMRFQPQIPYAVERLKQTGQSHWFDGEPATHWRKDLVLLFKSLLEEANANGYPTSRYCSDALYGHYRKASVANAGKPGSNQAIHG